MSRPSKSSPLIIVGSGVFGLGPAYELAAVRGYSDITVLDRFAPRCPMAAALMCHVSSELSMQTQSTLDSVDALKEWRGSIAWSEHYHESGFIMLGTDENGYVRKRRTMREVQGVGPGREIFDSSETDGELKELYPDLQADLSGLISLRNTMGGWADATNAIRGLAERASRAGISFITGKRGTAVSLEYSGRRVVGVRMASGTVLKASTVVLATGF
ncbi:hypothetical protein ACJ41O_012545 [Fusarium nematophilum]